MKFSVILYFIILFSSMGWAYPELTRFQYNTCTACHVSPAGGGLLTPYGRNLSHEILSTWGTEKEAGVLHGLIDQEKLNDWLLVGGDVRVVQTHHENAIQKTGRFIEMQADVAVGYVRETFAIVAQFGELENDGEEKGWSPEPTSFYAMWKPTDELTLRAGNFVPQYGIYMSDHFAYVKQGLGFGLEANRPVIEGQWMGEKWTNVISFAQGSESRSDENALTVQTQYLLGESSKVAANYWHGIGSSYENQMAGIWMLLGFSPRVFWVNEFDWKTSTDNGSVTRGFFTYHKLGYTLSKGLDALLIGEFQHSDLNSSDKDRHRYGVGAQFFPRPHFEISGAWTKQIPLKVDAMEEDYAWLLFHYYL